MGTFDYLYANGCSWTSGNGAQNDPSLPSSHVDHLSLAWPRWLAELLKVDVLNDSTGGGSNDRIVRTTLDFIKSLPTDRRKTTLVVIGFTTPDRGEIFLEDGAISGWFRFNAGQDFREYTESASLSKQKAKSVEEYRQQFIKHVYSTTFQVRKFFDQIYLLKNTLENLEIPYLFFMALPWFWDIGNTCSFEHDLSLYQNDPHIIDLLTSFNDFMMQKKLPMSDCMHPMIQGHKAWAEHLNNELKLRNI